jgi:hypothetical protein
LDENILRQGLPEGPKKYRVDSTLALKEQEKGPDLFTRFCFRLSVGFPRDGGFHPHLPG